MDRKIRPIRVGSRNSGLSASRRPKFQSDSVLAFQAVCAHSIGVCKNERTRSNAPIRSRLDLQTLTPEKDQKWYKNGVVTFLTGASGICMRTCHRARQEPAALLHAQGLFLLGYLSTGASRAHGRS